MELPDSYYAVIFTSKLKPDTSGYDIAANEMEELCRRQVGFLGMEHARSEIGITVCYWASLEAIEKWRNHSMHLIAQQRGKSEWYEFYDVKICQVVKSYHS